MTRFLKQELRLHWHELAIMLASIWGIFAVGVALVVIIVRFAADGTYAEMGTFCASLFAAMLLISRFGVWGQYNFSLAVSMGQTRRAAIASLACRIAAAVTLASLSVILFSAIESNLYAALYPTYTNEIAMSDILSPSLLLGVAAGLMVLLLFASAMINRFGRNGWIILWAVWMFGCLILPRLLFRNHDTEASPFFAACYRIIDAIGTLSGSLAPILWMVLAAALLAALLIAAYRMFMRAELRF